MVWDMQPSQARFVNALVDAASTRPFLNALLTSKRERERLGIRGPSEAPMAPRTPAVERPQAA